MRFWRWFQHWPLWGRLLFAAAVLLALLSFDWQPQPPAGLPRVLTEGHASGELRAGAARELIVPPFAVPIAGFDARPDEPFTGVLDPPGVRALTLEVGGKRVALVSIELVLVSSQLRERVLAAVTDLHYDELFLAATHTHSGPGGFWRNRMATWLGVGAFDPRVEEFLVQQTAKALHESAQAMKPARLSQAAVEPSNFASNRNDPSEKLGNRMTAARVMGTDGQQIANVVIYAVHPTIMPADDDRLTGDWPGALMTAFEKDGGPTTLFFQGSVGDVTWAKRRGEYGRQERIGRFGGEIATESRAALAAGGEGSSSVRLDWARVQLALPSCDVSGAVPHVFAGAASNIFCWAAELRTTQTSYVRIGDLQFATLPGELVTSLDLTWGKAVGAALVSLSDDYIGTIEAPAKLEQGKGESRRSYFGPALAPAVFAALTQARTAALRTGQNAP
jgi:hypothetical protein